MSSFAQVEVEAGVFTIAKPDGILPYHGWHGHALRVPPDEYERRLRNVYSAMDAEEIDLLIVVQPEDLYYLTGFYTIGDVSPQSLIIPKNSKPFMVARLIEVDLVPKLCWVEKVWTCPDHCSIHDVFCRAVDKVLSNVIAVIGVQLSAISANHHQRLNMFFEGKKQLVLRDASKTVESVRLLRSEYEQNCIKRAAEMSEQATQAGIAMIKKGVLLSEIHAVTYAALIKAGSEVPGYVPIVRSTDPSGHGSWMAGECVTEGNLVFLEMSGCYHGHHSPLMRTAYVLSPTEDCPPLWLLEAEKLIQKTFDDCLPMMVPGARACDIDAAGRKIMTSNSFGMTMAARLAYCAGGTATQPTGHAGWGDADFSLVGHNEGVLKAGMTFHFIPWFQKYDKPSGPIGMSDTVIVTPAGGRRFGSLPLSIKVFQSDGSEWRANGDSKKQRVH